TALDREARIGDADDDPEPLDDLRARLAGVERSQRLRDEPRTGATPFTRKEDVYILQLDCRIGGHRGPPRSRGRLSRSRMIASSTIAKPASKPMPTCTEFRARTTGTPSPPAPTKAAITT